MTLKHDRDAAGPDESGVPDEKVDPLVQGWQTALGGTDDDTEHDDATADEVARNEDLERNASID